MSAGFAQQHWRDVKQIQESELDCSIAQLLLSLWQACAIQALSTCVVDRDVYLQHCCIKMHSALVWHQILLLDHTVEHVHQQGLATPHTAIEVEAWSTQTWLVWHCLRHCCCCSEQQQQTGLRPAGYFMQGTFHNQLGSTLKCAICCDVGYYHGHSWRFQINAQFDK